MNSDTFSLLIHRLDPANTAVHIAEISDAEMSELSAEQVQELLARFGSNTLIRLPEREQQFFEWLRQHDAPVWEDLWGGDQEPYIVSLGYLSDLLPGRRGFLICDLAEQQNFIFSSHNITHDEGKLMVDAALDVLAANGRLTMDQAFMVEVWRGPIDLWRFTYMYGVSLAEAKRMILWLISEGALLLTVPEEDQTPSPEMNMMGHSVAHHPIAPASHHAEMEMEQDDDDFDNEAEDNEGEQQP
ncbi:MAG: hypothetical protein IT211_01625 [Armatimonadetes bacterium]|nr:hypothetical protein [Armatimonadota bacterium]